MMPPLALSMPSRVHNHRVSCGNLYYLWSVCLKGQGQGQGQGKGVDLSWHGISCYGKKKGALKQLFKLCTAFWLPMLINSWKIARNYEDDDDDDDFT